MSVEYRRFKITGTPEQQRLLEQLLKDKHISRDELTLILHTVAFRDPSFDTLSK